MVKTKETEEAVEHVPASDPEFMAQVVELRDEQELKWPEVAEQLECQQGKAMLAYLIATIPAKERIKAKTDEEFGEKIVAARDEDQNSWGRISARTGLPESKVRKLYEETSGVSPRGLRIGKGGRWPEGEKPEKNEAPAKKAPAKKAAATKAVAKKAPAAKKAAAPKGNPLLKMDEDQLRTRLTNKIVTIDRGDARPERISIKSVKSLDGDELNVIDKDGKARTILVADITKASR